MKVALVTGASRGIGKAVALRLARDGYDVAVNYAHSKDEALAVVAQIEKLGRNAVAVQADVGLGADAEKLFEEIESKFGKLDVLVNNAGVMKLAQLGDAKDEDFDAIFDTNVKGVFNTLRLASRRLNEGGRIVNFSSSAIALGLPGYALYVASKSAVETMSYVFSKELRGRNITVNCVAPGPTSTELFYKGKSDQQVEMLTKLSPLERIGAPDDIAGAVSFLCGADGAWVNGQVLRVNGGVT